MNQIVTAKDKIITLEEQLNSRIKPDVRIQKMDLLRHLYDSEGRFQESDSIALEVISDATRLVKMGDSHTEKLLSCIKNSYFSRAKRHFDDYMIACEWDREKNARFWLPRRKVLEGQHKICTQIDNFRKNPEKRFLGFSMPPGTGKSTLIKFFLAFVCGLNPQSLSMYVSYADGMVKMMYNSVSSILTDTMEYRHNDIFEGLREPDMSGEYNTISYRRKGDFPTLGLVSLSGSVTGRTRANTFMITDDLVKNMEVARSPERLIKLYDDYKSTLTTRMIGDKVKQLMLGTIWSKYDPISRMKEEHEGDPRYDFIAIPVWDEVTHVSNFNYDHPDRYSTEKIEEIKEEIEPVLFECMYMSHGIEREGLAFPSDSLRYYNGVLPDGEPDIVLFVCDVAWGGGDSLSSPFAYGYGNDYYIHDVVFNRGDKTITKPLVIGKIVKHRANRGRFEANNGGDEYADDVSKMLREDYGYWCNIEHKKAPSNMSKVVRIEQHAPTIRQNFIFLDRAHRNREYQNFIDELTSFTFTGKNLHDDAADSMAMLADFAFNRNMGEIVIRKRTGKL